MEPWKPSCHRSDAIPVPASTRSTSRRDSGNSGWAWSAAEREEDWWPADEGNSGSGALDKDNGGWEDPWWDHHVGDPWKPKSSSHDSVAEYPNNHAHDGWLDDGQLRRFNVAQIENTTAMSQGRWHGEVGGEPAGWHGGWGEVECEKGKPSEKLSVPEFDGEGSSENELGKSAHSFVRKVQVWLRCTKLPPRQRGLALYNALTGKAWIYAEELDVDRLATEGGVSYFLQWVQTRFMEVEVSKVAQMMSDLFKKGRRRHDQPIRDFNVEFERMVLRLNEIQCQVPPMIKAWLYLDKLRLSETEELALLSSVNNEYDCRKLQHAALLQDRTTRRPGAFGGDEGRHVGKRWPRHSVHMTSAEGDILSSGDEGEPASDDEELVDEDTAMEHYTAYMTYQGAKAKYKEVLKGRGVDKQALESRNQDRLRLAKQRSYCSACKRRGHWHKDPECPLRQKGNGGGGSAPSGGDAVHTVNFVHQCFMTQYDMFPKYDMEVTSNHEVHPGHLLGESDYGMEYGEGTSHCHRADGLLQQDECFMTEECIGGDHVTAKGEGRVEDTGQGHLLAIIDTACTKTVAGYSWFEQYVKVADLLQIPVITYEECEHFRFGASKIFKSMFGIKAWFGIHGRRFAVRVSIVPCRVPLLFSRPILGSLGLCYDVAKQQVGLSALELRDLPLVNSPTGHPALLVSDFEKGSFSAVLPEFSHEEAHIPTCEAYMSSCAAAVKPLFFPKKLSREIQLMLESEEVLGSHSFVTWWKSANQSKDFWMETQQEFIRVHVVPRKHPFSPHIWNTTLHDLKHDLLEQLDGHRITEHIPCLGEGLVVQSRSDENFREFDKVGDIVHPWIGRSRFRKIKTVSCDSSPSNAPHLCANAKQRTFTMVDEASRAGGGAGDEGGSSESVVVSARTPVHPDRTERGGEAAQDGHRCEGPHQALAVGASDGGRGAVNGHAAQADKGAADEDDQRCQGDTRPDSGELRQIQGLDVPRDSPELSGVEHPGDKVQCERPCGPGALGDMGPGGVGEAPVEAGRLCYVCEQGPGGSGNCATTQVQGHGSPRELVRQLLEQGRRLLTQSSSYSPWAGDHQRQRPGGGARGHQSDNQEVGRPDCCSQEAEQPVMDKGIGASTVGTCAEAFMTESAQHSNCATANTLIGDIDNSHMNAPDENQTVEYKDTIGLGTGSYEVQYNTDTLDTPDEDEVSVDEQVYEAKGGVPGGGGPGIGSARERACAGIRRRKMQNRSFTKKIKAEVHGLFNILMACTVMAGSWTHEVVSDPLWEAWALFQPQHHVQHREAHTDCLELFAGEARISGAYARHRRSVLQPRDIKYNHDLRRQADQDEVLDEIVKQRPKLVWMAPPCT